MALDECTPFPATPDQARESMELSMRWARRSRDAFIPRPGYALFGIAVMDGIIILSQFNNLIDNGMERTRAIIRTGELQMRPVMMTCIIAGVGLLPAALSSGIGSQVQKPLAIVVVGGMMLAPIVILVTLPVLIAMFSRRREPQVYGEAPVRSPAE